MNINTTHISCGVRQATGLYGDNKNNAISIGNSLYDTSSSRAYAAMIIFSDVATRRQVTGGHKFAEYLRSLECGNVEETSEARNPNSGNHIKLWIFIPNHRKFRPWWKANRLTAASAR